MYLDHFIAMLAPSGSETAMTSSSLNVVSSCQKDVLGEKSSEDNDLTACSTSSSKRMKPAENESCPWPTLDASLWNMLKDDLVEKIIARLPFKSLFRASVLSKAWSQNLLNHSFQSEVLCSTSSWESYSPLFANDEEELIGYESNSQQWHRLATELYFWPSVEEGPCPSLVEQRTWLWSLNLMAVGGSILCWMLTTDEACECYKRHPRSRRPPFYPFYLCVSNPLTKSWKQLPPCPQMKIQGCEFESDECVYEGYGGYDLYEDIKVHVGCQGTNAYQVILSQRTMRQLVYMYGYKQEICVYIFESGSSIWTMYTYKLKSNEDDDDEDEDEAGREVIWTYLWSQNVYINGVIYLGITYWMSVPTLGSSQVPDKPHRFSLISFDLENKTWSAQNLSINELEEGFINPLDPRPRQQQRSNFWHSLSFVKLVVCGSNVMLIVFHEKGKISGRESLCVYGLDLEFGVAFAVSTAPRDILDLFMEEVGQVFKLRSFYCAAGVGDCIIFSGNCRSRRSLMYNVTTQKWDWIPPVPEKFGPFLEPPFRQPPWTLTAYQPGVNPFLEV